MNFRLFWSVPTILSTAAVLLTGWLAWTAEISRRRKYAQMALCAIALMVTLWRAYEDAAFRFPYLAFGRIGERLMTMVNALGSGKNEIEDLQVRFAWVYPYGLDEEFKQWNVGHLRKNGPMGGLPILSLPQGTNMAVARFDLLTRDKSYIQEVVFRKIGGDWEYASRIYDGMNGPVLYADVSPGFPSREIEDGWPHTDAFARGNVPINKTIWIPLAKEITGR